MIATYILITLVAVFGHSEDFLGTSLLSRPLVLGPLVGLILGDPVQGIVIGATLELIFMGNIKVGAAIPPDVITGGVLGTAFALLSGKGASVALGLAVPISILAEMILSGLFIFRSGFNARFAHFAEEGDFRKFERLHVFSGLLKPLLMGLLVFLALQLGAETMKTFLDKIPAWVNQGLQVGGNLLPALGFALLMNVMFNNKVAPYFFLGFILSSYLQMPMIAIGGLGIVLALILGDFKGQGGVKNDSNEIEEKPLLSKKDIRAVFLRSFALEANFNFETCQNTGFAFSLIPVLRKIYKKPEQMALALKRHLQFFNTSPYGSTLILGIAAAMEESNAKSQDFNADSINTVKSGLMGPLAGVFDSLFWGTLKVIAAGIGVSLALEGSFVGPVLFVLIYNVPNIFLRYKLATIGYDQGSRFLQRLSGSALMDSLTHGASIVGLMVVGAMPPLLMSVSVPLEIGSNGTEVALQSVLDQIAPGLIPLLLTFLVYYLLKKNVKVAYLLLGLLTLGFVGSMLNVLA
ncbi:PTS system mannose/fructose/sorbose family transporter subunit IID [Marinilongibacter aquaticus]|uniref:PTS system mannose/fructose/sorbose family transporter subunit IID n=1 Tax=Marinilongibacter aquaticus TaxID=2975157 RepID=UPI0021BD07F1|nr:PTS system mannose/fructose/sorbose family transporter subunit IID [Marinilongibacter aquaticus]UBM58009.1 PTS system mannose/fructose/sorbose family transporter subunit IID [Marinilongibacter aquaticus]